MFRHMRILLMAAFSAFALTACGEGNTLPVEPDGRDFLAKRGGGKGGGNGGPTTAGGQVSMTLGMVTVGSQNVRVMKDSKRELALQDIRDETDNMISTFHSQLSLNATFAAGATAACRAYADPLPEALLTTLVDASRSRYLNLVIDKTRINQPSAKHTIAHTWTDDGGTLWSFMLGAPELLDEESSTVIDNQDGSFTFTGGAVRIWNRNTDEKIACPNLDSVRVQVSLN